MTTTAIRPGELEQLLREEPATRLVDVRTGAEFASVHIPGSLNVPLDTLSEHARELAGTERPVVLVCQSGARAGQAAQCLNGAGRTDRMRILDGGIAAWQSSGGDVVVGDTTRWAMDRQVRLVAGGLVLTGIVASTVAPRAKWLAGAIGAGLTFSAVTNTCGMAMMLAKLPYNRTEDTCDIGAVLAELDEAA